MEAQPHHLSQVRGAGMGWTLWTSCDCNPGARLLLRLETRSYSWDPTLCLMVGGGCPRGREHDLGVKWVFQLRTVPGAAGRVDAAVLLGCMGRTLRGMTLVWKLSFHQIAFGRWVTEIIEEVGAGVVAELLLLLLLLLMLCLKQLIRLKVERWVTTWVCLFCSFTRRSLSFARRRRVSGLNSPFLDRLELWLGSMMDSGCRMTPASKLFFKDQLSGRI